MHYFSDLFWWRYLRDNLGLSFYPYRQSRTLQDPDQTSADIWIWNMGTIQIFTKPVQEFFERKILRAIFGPTNDNGEWRIRYKNEFLSIKPALCSFLGIYCTLVSSTCFGCYVHPSSGAQLVETRPWTTHHMRTYIVPSRLYITVLLSNIRNM